MRIVIALALALLFLGCAQKDVIELNDTEVVDYKGEKLSSINDFRENSIKGPST